MPTVPTYDHLTEQPQELPGARETVPNAVQQLPELGPGQGVRFGQQVQQFGSDMAQLGIMQREARATDQSAQFQSAINAILNHPENGYLNTQGKNAIDGMQPTKDTLENLRQAMEDQLPDDATKAMFRRVSQANTQAATEQIYGHAGRQTVQYSISAAQARAQEGLMSAMNSYAPSKMSGGNSYAQGVATYLAEMEKLADMRGFKLPPDGTDGYGQAVALRKQFIMYGPDGRSGLAAMHQAVVDRLVEKGDMNSAQMYISQAKEEGRQNGLELPAGVEEAMNHTVTYGNMRAQSMQLMDRLSAQSANPADQKADLDTMLQNKEITQELYDATLPRWENAKRGQAEQNNTLLTNTFRGITNFRLQYPNATVTDLPPEMWRNVRMLGVDPEVREMFKHSGRISNPEIFLGLMKKLSQANAGSLLNDPAFEKNRMRISAQEWNEVQTVLDAYRGNTPQGKEIISQHNMVERAMNRLDTDANYRNILSGMGKDQAYAAMLRIREQVAAAYKNELFHAGNADKENQTLQSIFNNELFNAVENARRRAGTGH